MARPNIPNQKKKYQELNNRLDRYTALIEQIYESLNLEAARIVETTDYSAGNEGPFSFSNYPQTQKRIADLQAQFVNDINTVIYHGTSEEWKNSNEVQDLMADKVLKAYNAKIDKEKYKILYQTNSDALKAFQNRKDKGFNVSSKLWQQSTVYKEELEAAISCAIQKGTSAITLSKQISKYLLYFPSLQKDYKDKYGSAEHLKDCEYRSIRLARSEINMAYRTAENERWKQMDFVVGYEIKLSGNHNCKGVPNGQFYDVCDALAGKYPKDFTWVGWHPNCYSDDSEVLTNRGWKLFKDVFDDDLILSLNPTNRTPEWVEFTDRQCYRYNGDMIHFFNKSLDCLVTPDHNMVYLNKNDGRIKNCQAKEYTKGKGAFYRGCEYESEDVAFYEIDNIRIPFDLFCEFMGYWLSDGSTMGNAWVVIAQQEGEPARNRIVNCVKRIGFEPHLDKQKVAFYSTPIRNYLKIFGKCSRKFIPSAIKNASVRQIRIFLNAFVLCDGYRRPCKSFVGNHGTEFKSDKDEILYFTVSERMAGDLSELILKSGNRPSFSVNKAGVSHKSNGSIITSNYDCYSIRECYSVTATVFHKEIQHYDGFVYDLTLEKNHIMYIRRNGKCFWGSNCRCYKIPILKTEEEFWEWDGRSDVSTESVNEVKDVPDAFKQWVGANAYRIEKSKKRGTLPYFVRDNQKRIDSILDYTPTSTFTVYKIAGMEQLSVLDGSNYELTKAVSDVESNIRQNKGHETGVLFNKDGNIVIYKRGGSRSVQFTKHECLLMNDGIFTHNHPSAWGYAENDIMRIGNSFSIQDIALAVENNLAEMRAVTPNYTFSMKRPEGGWGISVEELIKLYNDENRNLRLEFTRRINKDTLTISQASATHFHILWKRLSKKLGFDYSKMKTK